MKKTALKRIGKYGKRNISANKKIAAMWERLGITTCEIREKGCQERWPLSNAHKHKRDFYRMRPELLHDYDEVIRSCQNCHDFIEYDKIKTESVFKRLRP